MGKSARKIAVLPHWLKTRDFISRNREYFEDGLDWDDNRLHCDEWVVGRKRSFFCSNLFLFYFSRAD